MTQLELYKTLIKTILLFIKKCFIYCLFILLYLLARILCQNHKILKFILFLYIYM